MKTKFIFLLIALVALSNTSLYSELKHFLPRTNASMYVMDRVFSFEGDTIINEMRYTKIYVQSGTLPEGTTEPIYDEPVYYGAVREDTIGEKIYGIQVKDGVERLLADFAVEPGDKVTVYSFWPMDYRPKEQQLTVTKVDSVIIDNKYRKRIEVKKGCISTAFEDAWIEGIGSIFGLFFPSPECIADLEAPPLLLCFYINDILIYHNTLSYYNPETPCFEDPRQYGGLPEESLIGFKLFPVPADKLLFVEKENRMIGCSYKIYNPAGVLVLSGSLSDEGIDVSGLIRGIYYITFYHSDGTRVYSSRFIKK